MASVLYAKKDIQQHIGSLQSSVSFYRPSKIPVWTGRFNGSSSGDEQRFKSIGKSQSEKTFKLPVASISNTEVWPKSGPQAEIQTSLSISQARCNEAIEQGLKQVLPGIMKQLLSEVGRKKVYKNVLPEKRKEQKPGHGAIRKTSAKKVSVSGQTHRRLPGKAYESNSSFSESSLKTHKFSFEHNTSTNSLNDSEPESVPKEVQSESDDLSDGDNKADYKNDFILKCKSPSFDCLTELDDFDGSGPESHLIELQNDKEMLSEGIPEYSQRLEQLNLKSEDDLDHLIGSDSELKCKNVQRKQENALHEQHSESSIDSKLCAFDVEYEAESDELYSSDSESACGSSDIELKFLSDDNIEESGDEKSEANYSNEEQADLNDKQSSVLLKRRIKHVLVGLVTSSNDKSQKHEARTCNNSSSSQNNTSNRGSKGSSTGQVQGTGLNTRQGCTAGGSGDDDPNDPPKPRKEPDDKKDDNDENEKRKAVKKALINQLMGISGIQIKPQGDISMENPQNQESNENPLSETTALKIEKSSQTNDEGNVEVLQKTIESKDREIALMQNLVNCCRKDYEELQESFNGYIDEFAEVDEKRAIISAMNTDINILIHENSKLKNKINQRTEEVSQLQNRIKNYQNKISKMEVNIEFLKSERVELSKKLKQHTASPSVENRMSSEAPHSTVKEGQDRLGENVKVMKNEEENEALKLKLEQCEASLTAQNKENTELRETLANQKLNEDQLKSRIQSLIDENDRLNSKCIEYKKQYSEISVEEVVQDLRRLHAEISEARKDLVNDDIADNNFKESSSSALSIELAEADNWDLQNQPEINPASEMHTLTYSITALTEELREQIAKSKVRLARAYSDTDYNDLKNRSNEKVKELNEEIDGLHEKLEEEEEKSKALENLINCSNTERERLKEWVAELQQELSNIENNQQQEITYKNENLDELKRAIEIKDQNLNEMIIQHQDVLETNDALRGVIHTLNINNAANSSKIIELESYLGELESENENMYKQLCEKRTNLERMQRQNDERQAFSKDLRNALQKKTESLVDVLDTVDKIAANPGYHDHPCVSAIDTGLQIVYDVTGLLNAYTPSWDEHIISNSREPLHEGTREQDLEIMIEQFKEENNRLKEDKQRLQRKLKEDEERLVEYDEGNKFMDRDEMYMLLKATQDKLQDKEMEQEKIKENITGNIEDGNSISTETYSSNEKIKELQETVNDLRHNVQMYEANCSKKEEEGRTEMNLTRKGSGDFTDESIRQMDQEEELSGRVNELDKCMASRVHLQDEFACCKDIHLKQKEDVVILAPQKDRMDDESRNSRNCETDIKIVRKSSLEIIKEMEKQLQERQDSELELQQRAQALRLQVDQFKAEKLENDRKVQSLMDSMSAKQSQASERVQNNWLKDKISNMESTISELIKEKESAERKAHDEITALRKCLKDYSGSETMLRNEVLFLKSRISQLNAEKAERDVSIQNLYEALNAQANVEEQLKVKENEVEVLKLKLSKVRATKKNLRRDLEKMRLENHLTSTTCRNQIQMLKDEISECTEREKELNGRIEKLSEERQETEKSMKAQVTLIKKASDEKLEEFEKLLRTKSHSEIELQDQKTVLEQEMERVVNEHNRIISIIVKTVKAKEDLAKAVQDKDNVEKDYKIQVDEIEMVVNKLRKEKNKSDCNATLKGMYKNKYYELCKTARKLKKDLENNSQRVKELQAVVLAAIEEKERAEGTHEGIETLKESLKIINARDVELYRTLDLFSSKISSLENDKAEGEKIVKALLKSMEDKQKIHHGTKRKRNETAKTFLGMLCEVVENVHRLTREKRRIENDLEKIEKMMATARSETEVLHKKSYERISGLEQSLKERYISETALQERLKLMDEKVVYLESEKQKADTTIETMLSSLKCKDQLEERLREKEESEKQLKLKILELHQEKQEMEKKIKELKIQSSDEQTSLRLQMDDLQERAKESSSHLGQEIEMLKKNLTTVEKESRSYEKEVKKYKKLLDERKDNVQTSILREKNLRQQLTDAESAIAELFKDSQIMKEELRQIKLESTEMSSGYLDKIDVGTDTMQLQDEQEKELQQMFESLTKQTKQILEEKDLNAEHFGKIVENLNNELEIQSKRETELEQQVKKLDEEISQSRMVIGNLVIREAELLKEKDSEVTRNMEHVKKIEELMSSIKKLEEENRTLNEDYKNYQSSVSKLTLSSRDTVLKLQKDLEDQSENNEQLKIQLRGMMSSDRQKEGEHISAEYEKKIRQLKCCVQRHEQDIKNQKHLQDNLRKELLELKIKNSELEKRNYEQHAENRRQQYKLISESKRAEAKLDDLKLHLQQRVQFEERLKNDIEIYNNKISELNLKIKNEQLKRTDMEKLYNISKGRVTELEFSIGSEQELTKTLRKNSEELREQVVRLNVEKDNLANALDDNYRLMLEQRDMQIKLLKSKIDMQRDKIKESTRENHELTQLRGCDHTLMKASTAEPGVNMHRGNDDHRYTTKVIMDSLSDSERRIGKLKSSWQFLEELQNRSSSPNDNIHSNTTYTSYNTASAGYTRSLV